MAESSYTVRLAADERLRAVVGRDGADGATARVTLIAPHASVHIYDDDPDRLADTFSGIVDALRGGGG